MILKKKYKEEKGTINGKTTREKLHVASMIYVTSPYKRNKITSKMSVFEFMNNECV